MGSHQYLNWDQQLSIQPLHSCLRVAAFAAVGTANKMHTGRKACGNSRGKCTPQCIALTSNTLLGSEHLVFPLAVVAEGIHHLTSSRALTFNHPIIWFLSESREINKLNLAFTQI